MKLFTIYCYVLTGLLSNLTSHPAIENHQEDTTAQVEYHSSSPSQLYSPGLEYLFDYYLLIDGKKYKYMLDTVVSAEEQREQFIRGLPLRYQLVEATTVHPQLINLIGLQIADPRGASAKLYPLAGMLRYHHYDAQNKLTLSEPADFQYNDVMLWMGLPAFNLGLEDLYMLSFCPDPLLQFPLVKGAAWAGEKPLTKACIRYEIKQSYEVVRRKNIKTGAGKFQCWEIAAYAEGVQGSPKATFYYNEEIGFTKMLYHYAENKSLVMNLKGTRQAVAH